MIKRHDIVKHLNDLVCEGNLVEHIVEDVKAAFAKDLEYAENRAIFDAVYAEYASSSNYLDKAMVIRSKIMKLTNKNIWFLVDQSTHRKLPYDHANIKLLFKKATDHILTPRLEICNLGYDPFKPQDFYLEQGSKFLNLYRCPDWRFKNFYDNEPIPACPIPPVVDEFLDWVFANEFSKTFALDWMAHSLRTKNLTYLMLIAIEGLGKGILGDFMYYAHGKENTLYIEFDKFDAKFNAHLANRTFIYVDELKVENSKQENNLKAFINPEMNVEKKGIDVYQATNFASYLMSSNFNSAVRISATDRRYSFPDLKKVPLRELAETKYNMKVQDYVKTVLETEPNFEGFARHLWTRTITSDLSQPPKTEQALRVRMASKKEWEVYFIQVFCKERAGEQNLLHEIIRTQLDNTMNRKVNATWEAIKKLEQEFPGVFTATQKRVEGKGKPRVIDILPADQQKDYPFEILD